MNKLHRHMHVLRTLLLSGVSVYLITVTGCASTPSAKLPPPPPKYVYQMEEQVAVPVANSLWHDSTNLFEDRKARRLNDLVTINIIESLSGSGTADTSTSRDSSGDYQVSNLFGMQSDFGIQNLPVIRNAFGSSDSFDPSVQGSARSDFKGKGDTTREGELIATITAKVMEVLPNGNLMLEARKELTINEERQILVLKGMVRPDDISMNNVVMSNKIADAEVFYVGDGVIQDKQKPGWLVRGLDKVWPF
ncbi:MAG: flagellar basal body L-ring protein FlgH [Nitrospiraceae bacterium]|nr:MAG: flagellar basal body L-ring protein FlgH [Nitrospiraceae bacterium]